jgi:hypothetical protein
VAYRKSKIPDPSVFRVAADASREAFVGAMDVYAQSVADGFRERIADQDFPRFRVILYPESDEENKNLSPQWVKRKRRKDADTRTMIATRTYVDSIRVWRKLLPRRRGGLWRVGFHRQKRARNLDGEVVDILLNDVALIHEHGNAQTPRRPHWGPHLATLKAQAPKARAAIGAKVAKAITKATSGQLVVKAEGL